jgi:hypothetical protein
MKGKKGSTGILAGDEIKEQGQYGQNDQSGDHQA